MRQKKVWRYYCDFCGKGGCSKGHMATHEKHCTMNPNRKCRMHKFTLETEEDSFDPNMDTLLSILPNPEWIEDEWGGLTLYAFSQEEITKSMDELRERADNCPACILSVLRQKGIDGEMVGFDFKKEKMEMFSGYNDSMADAYGY